MSFRRIGASLDFLVVVFEGLYHHLARVGEVLYELWNVVLEHAQHILIHQNLAVTALSRADADGRDRQLLADECRQLCRNTL